MNSVVAVARINSERLHTKDKPLIYCDTQSCVLVTCMIYLRILEFVAPVH